MGLLTPHNVRTSSQICYRASIAESMTQALIVRHIFQPVIDSKVMQNCRRQIRGRNRTVDHKTSMAIGAAVNLTPTDSTTSK